MSIYIQNCGLPEKRVPKRTFLQAVEDNGGKVRYSIQEILLKLNFASCPKEDTYGSKYMEP